MSPDPCHFASSTSAFSNSPESRAGRNRFKPVLVRISDLSRARGKINRCGVIPVSASIIGRANSSKVTMVDTGFPGSPKKYFLCGVDTPFDSLRPLSASSVRADGAAAAGSRAGPPGLNLRSRKVKLRLQFRENLLHQVVFPHGDAARQQQKIPPQSFLNQSPQ